MPKQSSSKQRWILIVEDEEELANLLSTKLGNAGFRVIRCGRVSDALQKVTNQRFACILLDMRLEQGSGERIIQFVRDDKTGYNFETPILVMSGHLSPDMVKKISKQVSGVLVKPFDHDTLINKIQSLCESESH